MSSLFDDLDALARTRSEREEAARRVAPTPRHRGRHRAPTSPWWALAPAPRHQQRPPAAAPAPGAAPTPPSTTSSASAPPEPPPQEPPPPGTLTAIVVAAHPAPAPTLPPTALARYARIGRSVSGAAGAEGADAEPVVLSYAGVEAQAGAGRAVGPRRLADHLAVLHATGHRTVGLDELLDHAAGRARLPARSVLIAFEPGARGLHRFADPVLAAHGARAVALVDGARPPPRGEPVGALAASGRWEVVAAGELGFAAPRRLGVTGGRTAAALLREIGEMAPVAVTDLVPNVVSRAWSDPAGGRAPVVADGADLVVGDVPPGVGEVVADWAPQRTAGWERYAVAARVVGLGGGAAGLRVRAGRVGEVSAVLSAGMLVLRRGGAGHSGAGRSSYPVVRPADAHVLRLDVDRDRVVVSVDDREVARVLALPGDHEPRVATAGSLGVVAHRGPDGGFPALAGLVVSAPRD